MRANVEQITQPRQFLSIPEVQNLLGIKSRKTILKYITTGKLCAYKVGGTRWRISNEDVDTFLKQAERGQA